MFGLGCDVFVLVSVGCKVIMIEWLFVVVVLFEDGICRLVFSFLEFVVKMLF